YKLPGGLIFYQSGLITEADGQHAFPLVTAQKPASFSLSFRPQSHTARLEAAVAAYQEALKERTRERVPLDWAATQNNLGNALYELGLREADTAKLEAAVAAYQEALKVWRGPDASMAQDNLDRAQAALAKMRTK